MHRLIRRAALALLILAAISGCSQSDHKTMPEAENTATAIVALDVQGMTCAGCETTVKMTLKKLDGVKDVEASFKDGSAKVTIDPAKVTEKEMVEALDKVGYAAKKKSS